MDKDVIEEGVVVEGAGNPIEARSVGDSSSKRDALLQRLHREGRDLSDDEHVFGAALEDMDEVSGKLKGYDDANGKLVDAIGKDPRLAAVLESVLGADGSDGYGFVRSLRDVYGDEIREAMDSDDMLKEMSDRSKSRMESDMANKKLSETQDANWANTGDVADAWAEKRGYSQDQKMALFEKIFVVFDRLWMGTVDEDLLDDFDKMASFDGAVKEAEELGAIKGKNEKIMLERKKIDRAEDMPPSLEGRGSTGRGGDAAGHVSTAREKKGWMEEGMKWSEDNGYR